MNKIILCGRICKELELRQTQSGTFNLKFSIAVDRKVSKDGKKQADFINCQAWSNTAEFIALWFDKGMKILITGRLENNNWEDKDGKKHYDNVVVIEEVEFADSKKDSGQATEQVNDQVESITTDSDELPF